MSAHVAHKWDTKAQHMPIEEEPTEMFGGVPIVDHSEAERLIESLVKFSIEEVGTSRWMEQHRVLEKLNIQAHQNAMTNSDEYVLEALLTFRKIDLLIDDLLVIEAWKEFVYPLLLEDIAGRNSMRVYFILYHEATLVNLFEVLLYHKHVVATLGEKVIELIDYSARKLTKLSSGYNFRSHDPFANSQNAKEIASSLEARSPVAELSQHFIDIEFRACISACSLARFLCEHADVLPLSALSRITDTHDLLILFIPLIENPPWTRRTGGKWQKLIDQKWAEVAPIDLLKITKLEGQPWLGLYHLVAKKEFRERYHLNTFRKGQLLRVRKYLNEILLDQLPILADIQRYMDELAIMEVPDMHSVGSSFLMLQQVAVARESILKGKIWPEVAAAQLRGVFTMTDRDDPDLRRIAELYSDDLAEDVLDPHPHPK